MSIKSTRYNSLGDGLRRRQLISKTGQFKLSPASSSLIFVIMVLLIF